MIRRKPGASEGGELNDEDQGNEREHPPEHPDQQQEVRRAELKEPVLS
jgi:hypothetical protein